MTINLKEIRERSKKATPGPWNVAGCNGELTGINGPSGFDHAIGLIPVQMEVYGREDANFIAHARQDIPALLDYIGKLTAIVNTTKLLLTDECEECGRRFYSNDSSQEVVCNVNCDVWKTVIAIRKLKEATVHETTT